MRVIDDTGENLGVLDKQKALTIAREKELDLVLINPQSDPPIARIISWSKFKYDLSKKKSAKTKSKDMKEMWFKPFIDKGDMDHKVSKIINFLKKGHQVKITIRTKRGSTRVKQMDVLKQVLEQLTEEADMEGAPKPEGRYYSVIVKPKK